MCLKKSRHHAPLRGGWDNGSFDVFLSAVVTRQTAITLAAVLLIFRNGATRVVVLGLISVKERKSPRLRCVLLVFSGWKIFRKLCAIGSGVGSFEQKYMSKET